MCPGVGGGWEGWGSNVAGSTVSQGWHSMRIAHWREPPGIATLVILRRSTCSSVAPVGAALLPPWTWIRVVTCRAEPRVTRAAAAARWAS